MRDGLPTIEILIAVGLVVFAPMLAARSPYATMTSFGFPSRAMAMPGYGRQQILSPSQIEDLTDYVLALSQREVELQSIERAMPLYEQHCQACHGEAGEGDEEAGVPDLRDDKWRWGGSREAIRQQIWRGDDGRGPVRSAGRAMRPEL